MNVRQILPLLVTLAFFAGMIGVGVGFVRRSAEHAAIGYSAIHVSLQLRYARGSILKEEYRMSDLDGISQAEYRLSDRHGRTTVIELVPQKMVDVAFFYGKVDHDGIWDLPNRPPRGDLSTSYLLAVDQTIGSAHGNRVVYFTDPRYWATTAGRSYAIALKRDKPVPNVIQLESTSLADPRYELIVDDFRAFGSSDFRARIRAARAQLLDKEDS